MCMSNSPESEFDLELHFLPAWAQRSPESNRYADHPGEAGEGRRERRKERRGPRREGPERAGPRRDRPRFGGEGGGGRPSERGQRPRRGPREERPKPLPLPELDVTLVPDDRGVESLAKQIRMTGRAYPLFEIAQMILKRPERHLVRFGVKKNGEGQVVQPIFVCALDESPWLSEDEAVRYVMEKHFDTFYQTERTKTDPPKGTYTFVAQCGMSGKILGPPNHHDYQNQLRKLHAERFSRMPFEAFKSRIKIVRDEAVVKQWLEEQSFKTEYVGLNMPEPVRFNNRAAVEKHFRETHLPSIIRSAESHELTGTAAQKVSCPALHRLVRHTYEQQRRFPLQIATVLSHQFSEQGLQFFKVNKSVTHVAVARPHYLDLDAAPVSENVRRIVTFIDTHPRCSRRQLLEGLLPGTAPRPAPPAAPAESKAPPQPVGESTESAPTAADTAAPAPALEPSPEQTAIIADLHWLTHQGHVIEFANGLLETAKKPLPKPVREPKTKPAGETKAEPATESLPESAQVAEPETNQATEQTAPISTPEKQADTGPLPDSAPETTPSNETGEGPAEVKQD